MFDWISSLYSGNSEFINGAASVTTLVLAILAVRSFFQGRKKRVFYQWVRKERAKFELPIGYEPTILFGATAGSAVVTDYITFSNRTDVTLTDDDFVSPPELSVIPSQAIYQYRLISPENASSGQLTLAGEKLTLHDFRLPRGATFTIYVAHDNAISKDLTSTTKVLPDLVETTFKKAGEKWIVETMLFAITIVAVGYVGLNFIDLMENDSVESAYKMIAVVGLIAFTPLAMTISTEWLPKKLGPIVRPLLKITPGEERFSESQVVREIDMIVERLPSATSLAIEHASPNDPSDESEQASEVAKKALS